MKVALAQLTSVDDISKNLKSIEGLVKEASEKNARLIIFPENSLYLRVKEGESIPEITFKTLQIERIKEISYENKIHIHLTLPFKEEGLEKLVNASLLFSPSGQIEIVYRKIHLFDIELEGQKPIKESDVFSPGKDSTTFTLDGFKFGSSICYDLRFSELYRNHAKEEVDAVVVPAAFLVKTGAAHWEVLLRARAIESQCYMLAPAQVGTHCSAKDTDLKRETYGHTLVIGPWGNIIAENKSAVGLVFVELEKSEITKVRKQIPMKSHRRLE